MKIFLMLLIMFDLGFRPSLSFAQHTTESSSTVLTDVIRENVDELATPLIKAINLSTAPAKGIKAKLDKTRNLSLYYDQFSNALSEMLKIKTSAEVNTLLDLALVKVITEIPRLATDAEFAEPIEEKIQNLISDASNGSAFNRTRNGLLIGLAVGVVVAILTSRSEKGYRPSYKTSGGDLFVVIVGLGVAGGVIGLGAHGIISLASPDQSTIDLQKLLQENPELKQSLGL